MMMVVCILQKVTRDLEEHKQHFQEFFELGLIQNLLYREINLRANIIQKGLNPLYAQWGTF